MRQTPRFALIAFGSRGAPSRTVWNICAWPDARRRAAHGGAQTRHRSAPRATGHDLRLRHASGAVAGRRPKCWSWARRRSPANYAGNAEAKFAVSGSPHPDRNSGGPAPDGSSARRPRRSTILLCWSPSSAVWRPASPVPRQRSCWAAAPCGPISQCGHRGRGVLRAQAMSRSSSRPKDARSSASAGGSRPTAGARPQWRTRRTRCKGSAAHGFPSPSLTRRARSRTATFELVGIEAVREKLAAACRWPSIGDQSRTR